MTSLYEKNYLQGVGGLNVLTTKIFTAWDYTVTDKEACFIKQQSIATDIQVKYGFFAELMKTMFYHDLFPKISSVWHRTFLT